MTLPACNFAGQFGPAGKVLTWPGEAVFYPLTIVAEANLPTRFGDFRIVAFSPMPDGKEHIAMVRGEVRGASAVPTRVHSECLTGDVMGSLRCDCRDQLEAALEFMATQDQGIVIYLRQEGRGIGLANKLRAYVLQEQGLDTVDANHALGFDDDERDYRVAAEMLRALGVQSITLLSNNPKKIVGLEENGIAVVARRQHQQPSNKHNHHYLQTKARRSGHYLEF
ncbi:MAG: GTP cyclohydrolase II [bacterium]|nr:GTP cyclohydrolase II [bacterium]